MIKMLLTNFRKTRNPNFRQDNTPHSYNFLSYSAVHLHVLCYRTSNCITLRWLSRRVHFIIR